MARRKRRRKLSIAEQMAHAPRKARKTYGAAAAYQVAKREYHRAGEALFRAHGHRHRKGKRRRSR